MIYLDLNACEGVRFIVVVERGFDATAVNDFLMSEAR